MNAAPGRGKNYLLPPRDDSRISGIASAGRAAAKSRTMKTYPALFAALFTAAVNGQENIAVTGVEAQPLLVQVQRVQEALSFLGEPLPEKEHAALAALKAGGGDKTVAAVQEILDPH